MTRQLKQNSVDFVVLMNNMNASVQSMAIRARVTRDSDSNSTHR